MKPERKLIIMVVEDNPLYQQLIAKQLESLSSSMCFFTSGEACMKEILDQDPKPEVVVMDYNLDGQMTGLDTLKAIREFFPYMYVVLFSDQQSLSTPDNIRFFGDFDFLEKNDTAFHLLEQKIRSSPVFLQKNLSGRITNKPPAASSEKAV